MAENKSNTRIRAGEQLVFINTGKIIGLQNISVTNNIGSAPLSYLGSYNRIPTYIPASQQSCSVSLNGQLINNDYFIDMTGAQPVNLFILKDFSNIQDNYCLVSGYMNSYSTQYSIGNIPQISAEMTFYGNAGTIPTGQLETGAVNQLSQIYNNNYSHLDSGYLIPDAASITLTLNEYTNNRILDYSINLTTNRVPVNNIGSRRQKRNELIYPIDVRCSFSFEVPKNYSGNMLFDFPQRQNSQTISLETRDFNNEQIISNYSFSNMILANESRTVSLDGNTIVSISYNGTIREFGN